MRVSKVLLDLYPDSAGAKGFAGVMAAVSGQTDRARTLLTESRQQEPNGYASKSNLEEIASALERMGAKDAAKLLRELP